MTTPPPAPLPPREDGLEHQYDVIIVGTGLVEAMLAAALTKVGKSVLHYEKEEYYGGEDWPSFHLEDLRAWATAHQGQREKEEEAPAPPLQSPPKLCATPPALQRQWPTTRWRTAGGIDHHKEEKDEMEEVVEEEDAKEAKKKDDPPINPEVPAQSCMVPLSPTTHSTICVLHLYEKKPDRAPTPDAVSEPAVMPADEPVVAPSSSPAPFTLASLLAKSRDFNLDLCPTVLMAGGDIISPLLSSGVANYLEFRPLQALYIAASSSSSTSTSSSPSFHKVPCSKADVFASQLLPAKEKRQLMKFLQFVADWGFRAQSGKDAHVRNETELGQGRSLQRPQNKATVDMDAEAFLEKPFPTFLTHCKMDSHLQWVVLHALALVSGEEAMTMTTEVGMRRVFKHLQGLGQYGNTAFLWPLYGSGDVIQAFCRTASVWGATFLLREQPTHLVLHPVTGQCLGVLDKEGGAVACEYVVLGPQGSRGSSQDWTQTTKKNKKKAVRRIVLLDSPPAALAGDVGGSSLPTSIEGSSSSSTTTTVNPAGHCGGVFPPGTLSLATEQEHPHPTVHFYCVDPPAKCAPADVYILYLSATLSAEEEQDPQPLFDAAVAALVASPHDHVIWALTYEQPLLLTATVAAPKQPHIPPRNVLSVHREAPEFYLQSPLEQAQALFQTICPGEAFLPAEVPEGVLQFDFLASNDEEDQEQEILERAMAQAALGSGGDASGSGDGGEAKKEVSAAIEQPQSVEEANT